MPTTTFLERLYPGYGQYFTQEQVLFAHRTEHQELIIFRNAEFGSVMALDGIIQTTERDEFIYHEMMTHLPLLAHGDARRVLIIGGGDGGILREVLKHRTVEQVTQVEIDQAVIDLCRQYLPNHSAGAFDDPRAQIVIGDGVEFVNTCRTTFDLIISDCTDPVGPGEVLFTSRFYEGCKRCLNPGGVFVAQNGVPFLQPEEMVTTRRRLGPYFADQTFYTTAVPTYVGGVMAFAWATDDSSLRQLDQASVQRRYAASGIQTRYYNPAVHLASFALPQYIVTALAAL